VSLLAVRPAPGTTIAVEPAHVTLDLDADADADRDRDRDCRIDYTCDQSIPITP